MEQCRNVPKQMYGKIAKQLRLWLDDVMASDDDFGSESIAFETASCKKMKVSAGQKYITTKLDFFTFHKIWH